MATGPSLGNVSGSKMSELRRRLVFLVLALVVFRVGAHIPVPGIDPAQLQKMFQDQGQGGILNLFNMFSGGALQRFSVFALGIMPYISASIVIQLVTYVIPTLEQLKKEGEAGQRKISQYTRYAALAGKQPWFGVVARHGIQADNGCDLDNWYYVPDVAG